MGQNPKEMMHIAQYIGTIDEKLEGKWKTDRSGNKTREHVGKRYMGTGENI